MSAATVLKFDDQEPQKNKRKVVKKASKPRRPSVLGMSAVDQVRQTFCREHRLSAVMGFILGGFMPLGTFTVVHHEVSQYPMLWILVAGGLAYSAISVYKWSLQAFRMRVKAIGFVLLLEGIVTLAHTEWLSWAGLAILVSINGISAAVALQTRYRDS